MKKLTTAHELNEIIQFVLELVNEREKNDYCKKLDRVLKSYLKYLNKVNLLPYGEDTYQVKSYITNDVKKINAFIRKSVKNYLEGKIALCYKKFSEFWLQFNSKMVSPNSLSVKIDKNDIWYRIRKGLDTNIPLSEMFHVPLSLRVKVGNSRYGIAGFPCLYLGKSIYTCWEETRRPKLSDFVVSAFRPTGDINLLDMRLSKSNLPTSRDSIEYYLKFLPFILASSIKTLDDTNVFKLEYIIPQLILHSIINSENCNYEGILYTSTRRDDKIDPGYCLSENIVLPIKDISQNSYCSVLAQKVTLTSPISYELIQLIDPALLYTSHNNCTAKYKNGAFGKMEYYLSREEFKSILDREPKGK